MKHHDERPCEHYGMHSGVGCDWSGQCHGGLLPLGADRSRLSRPERPHEHHARRTSCSASGAEICFLFGGPWSARRKTRGCVLWRHREGAPTLPGVRLKGIVAHRREIFQCRVRGAMGQTPAAQREMRAFAQESMLTHGTRRRLSGRPLHWRLGSETACFIGARGEHLWFCPFFSRPVSALGTVA